MAFSGGEDSSLVAVLASLALGRGRTVLAHIDWGMYEYEKTRKIVRKFAQEHGLALHIIDGAGKQKSAWKYGPSCNSCTKFVKLPLLREFAGKRLIATGSNAYDTWGKTGIKVKDGFYAPLSDLTKEEIRAMLEKLNVKIERIGESKKREGCKLKHLLKMLTNENFHGKAVALSNEILLKVLEREGIEIETASVKIAGPLKRNIAVVVTKPELDEKIKEKLKEKIGEIDAIDEVIFAHEGCEVVVVASKPIFKNPDARKNVIEVIGIPGKYSWIESKNTKLRTFQVVEIKC